MLALLHSLSFRIARICVAAVVAVPLVLTPTSATASAQDATLGLESDFIPPELGQSALSVYVPETGHAVEGYLLDYWRANGATSVYGNPISEPFAASNGLYSQAFERGVFQYSPYWMWTDDAAVRLMPISDELIKQERTTERSDGRRAGSDRRATSWQPGHTNPERAAAVTNEGGRWSEETGFSISGQFAAWYDSHEGWFYMGEPISEPMMQRGVQVQYYQNGVLMLRDGVVSPAPLPRERAERLGIDTTPIEQGNLPIYDESMFYTVANPYGVDPTGLTGQRRIVVSISEQTMRVYQGDTLVLETLVSTGLEPNDTEIGNFHVRIKFESQTMSGFTSDSGEVVGLGNEERGVTGTPTGNTYEVEDVPHVMYINHEAEALHGAYWHENFGQRMSHGCINQPLAVAAFIYEFAPLGTPVTVVE